MSKTSFQITRDHIEAAQGKTTYDDNASLFQQIEKARKIKDPALAHLEQKALLANIGLVSDCIKPYLNKGLEDDDICSEGIIGLMKAIKGYKTTSGNKFSTHASNSIKNVIKTALSNQSRTIRIPVYLTHIKRKVENRLRKNPNLSAEQLVPIIKEEFESKNTQKQVHLKSIEHCLRLIRMQKHSDDTLKYKTAEAYTITPEKKEQLEYLSYGLDQLDERTAEVIKKRFELQGHARQTLKEIGEELGLTRERVRQLETEGLKKLTQIYKEVNTLQNTKIFIAQPQP